MFVGFNNSIGFLGSGIEPLPRVTILLALTLPLTSSFACGTNIPMPTLSVLASTEIRFSSVSPSTLKSKFQPPSLIVISLPLK